MSTIKADAIKPTSAAADITLGASGDTVTVAANSINVNKIQDTGGDTLWDFSSGDFVSTKPEFAAQNLVHLQTQTASDHVQVQFQITDAYDVYVFKYMKIQPSVDNTRIAINFSTKAGGTYPYTWATKTSTYFRAIHDYNNTSTGLAYDTGDDLEQSTGDQVLCHGIGSDTGECGDGELYLFKPSSPTYIKHWQSRMNVFYPASGGYSIDCYTAGYINISEPIRLMQWKIQNGLFDGVIKMYGIL